MRELRDDVTGWSIDDFRAAARGGRSVVDLTEAALEGVGALPPGVLVGQPLRERALADATALAGADPDEHPLLGVPYVVKDNVDVAGCVTSAGCPGFGSVATIDATVVARLRRAGAIVVGRANMDQFATGLVGTRSPHGVPPNALRPGLVPGGSSSGSAVAVALGAVPFSIGTDTAGSGRVPAAFNGIVGFKPTVGSVSTAGIVPAVRRFDCPSVFARTVDEATAAIAAIAGPDPADVYSRARPETVPMPWPPVIGVPGHWPAGSGPDPEMRAWFDAAVDGLGSLGVSTVSVDIGPLLALGDVLYGSALVAERAAAVGHALDDPAMHDLDPTVAAIVRGGSRFSAVDAYRTEYQLAELRVAAATIWDRVDVLALPTTPRLATVDQVAADPIGVNAQLGRYTSFVNLADLAALVVPIRATDRTAASVPAGLQLIAPAWRDADLVRLGRSYAGLTRRPTR